MGLVPTDLPDRLWRAGLPVNVLDGWEGRGSSADHRCLAFHWTASSANESPSSCVNYSTFNSDTSPHYNLIVDRTGVVWVCAREKTNNAGNISLRARDEAHRGEANWQSAASRGLSDTGSSNDTIFAIAAQNNGTGEHWSDELVEGMVVAAAVVLDSLGLPHSSYLSHHAALTARKIDLLPVANMPNDWQARVNAAMHGTVPQPPEDEMWTISGEVPGKPHDWADDNNPYWECAIPVDSKNVKVRLYSTVENDLGPSLWGAQFFQQNAQGLWDGGRQWEMWLPGKYVVQSDVNPQAVAIRLENQGAENNRHGSPVLVTVSGT